MKEEGDQQQEVGSKTKVFVMFAEVTYSPYVSILQQTTDSYY